MNLNSTYWPGGMRGAWQDSLSSKNFDFGSVTLRPFGWRRIDFPKGDHRRPPAFVIRRFGEKVFGFIDFADVGDIECLGIALRAILSCFAASRGVLGGFLSPLPPPPASEETEVISLHPPFSTSNSTQLHST